MTLEKLPASKLPAYRARKLAEQGGVCPLTGWHIEDKDAAADHCHVTGMHRAILHKWANSTLGRIENWARRMGGNMSAPEVLRRCAAYIEHFEKSPTFLLHHTYKTREERREAARIRRNEAARKRRAAKKSEAE